LGAPVVARAVRAAAQLVQVVRLKVDVIVTVGSVALAAKQVKSPVFLSPWRFETGRPAQSGDGVEFGLPANTSLGTLADLVTLVEQLHFLESLAERGLGILPTQQGERSVLWWRVHVGRIRGLTLVLTQECIEGYVEAS
jgi:hypothetical protein